MSVSFDWDFSDETGSGKRASAEPPSGRRKRWVVWGVILIIALAILIFSRAWVARRLRAAEKNEAEFQAAVELEIKAVFDGDRELFDSLQDPADPNWQASQTLRHMQENRAFVPAPGLCPANRAAEIRDLHFFGSTGRAEIIRWYNDGCGETAASAEGAQSDARPFHQTWFYRRDDVGDWYHTAAPADYWGIPFSWHGNRLTVRGTEIEAERMDPVARDLAVLVSQACLWMECPEDDQYTMSFEDINAPQLRGDVWALPALYLVGLPGSDFSQALWQDALERWALDTLIASQVGDGNLDRRIVYQELRSGLLTRMGFEGNPEASPFVIDLQLLSQTLRDKTQHPLWSMWQALEDSQDPEKTRILRTEVAALLLFLEGKVGRFRIYQLLPGLGQYDRLSDALVDLFELDSVRMTREWAQFLEKQTGVNVAKGFSALPTPRFDAEWLESPPAPDPPAALPGNHVAAICNGRVWVGDANGHELVPITAQGYRFSNLDWSTDGHWLAAAWRPEAAPSLAALYLLAADGTHGELLSKDASVSVWPLGWIPEENAVVALAVSDNGNAVPNIDVRAFDAESGAQRQLPGMPYPSPDGESLAYVSVSAEDRLGTVSLAESAPSGEGDVVELSRAPWMWPSLAWSPESGELIFADVDDADGGTSMRLYDVGMAKQSTPLSIDDVLAAYEVFSDTLSIPDQDQAQHAVFGGEPMRVVLWGWSADGQHVAVSVHANEAGPYGQSSMLLAVVPSLAFKDPLVGLDGDSAPDFLVLPDAQVFDAAWSPSDPTALVASFLRASDELRPKSYLIDIDVGSVRALSNTGAGSAKWSHDGRWILIGTTDGIAITDDAGQTVVEIPIHGGQCHEVTWNPAADLQGLDGAAP